MNWKKTSMLGLIFLLILTAFWWFEIRGKWQKQRIEREKTKLLVGVDSIYDFKIETRSDAVEIAWDESSGQWRVVSPVIYPADNAEVGAVIEAARNIYFTDVVSDSGILKSFGLEPVPWVRFSTGNLNFSIGEETPTKSGVYARIGNSPRILLVPGEFREKLLKVPFDLRDKSILPPIDITQIDSVILVRPSGDIHFVKKGMRWEISFPFHKAADNNLVGSVLRGFTSIKAAEFAAEDHADSTFKRIGAQSSGSVKIFTTGGIILELNIVAQFEKDTLPEFVYLWTPWKNPLFEIPMHHWHIFHRNAVDFRSRSLEKVLEANAFAIHGPADFKIEGKLSDTGWVITEPDSARGDSEQIENFMRNVQLSRIDSFKTDGKFESSGWKFSFIIADDTISYIIGDSVEVRIQIMPDNNGEYYMVHKTNILKWCKPNPERFISKRLIELDATDIDEIVVDIGGDRYFIKNVGSEWQVKTPHGKGKFELREIRFAVDAVLKMTYTDICPDTNRWDGTNTAMNARIKTNTGNEYYIDVSGAVNENRFAIASSRSECFIIPLSAIDIVKRKLERILERQ